MRNSIRAYFVAFLSLIAVAVGTARAEDISGTIVVTKVIFEDSQLVGDVTCTITDSPCIDLGASNIKLRLNGFTMTGPASPDSPPNAAEFCNTTSGAPGADGIRILNQINAEILGPGIVQKFRRHGILIVGTIGVSTRAKVKQITSDHNCFSGLLTNGMSESVIEEVVSVRNANNSGAAPCGGNCLVNSHSNVIRRNLFGGNGSVLGTAGNNDFGVGLINGSSGNLIEDNSISGNTNGILLHATAVGNVIRRNAIAGNPPGQVTRDYGSAVGFDILDQSGVADDTFWRTWCITYSGPAPAVCPSLPGPPQGGDN